jgi:hypothetical protein
MYAKERYTLARIAHCRSFQEFAFMTGFALADTHCSEDLLF